MPIDDPTVLAAVQETLLRAWRDRATAPALFVDGAVLPAGFVRREIMVAPRASRPYDAVEWRDSLVVVERGEIEVECLRGGSRRFACGTVMWLTDLSLRTIHNRGDEPVVLVAIARRRTGER
jgi:hypothetical protein